MRQLPDGDYEMVSPELARRNGRRAIVNAFLLSTASFLLPIWQLFYTLQLGLGLTQAMVLSASSWIVTGIANIPTGVWADKYGRLKLFRVGVLLSIITYVPMLFTKQYAVLFCFSLISGFATSMLDGSLEANAMDSYEKAGLPKKESTKFGSSQMAAAYMGRIGSGVLGAWLYSRWPYAPLLANIAILTGVFLQSYMIVEVRSEKPSELRHWKFMKTAMSLVRSNNILATFMVVTLMITIGCESFWSAFQQYLILRNEPAGLFGVMFGIIAAVSAFSAWGYRKIHERMDWLQTSFVTLALMTMGLLLAHLTLPGMPYIVAATIGLGFGLIYPVAYDVVQHNVRSQYRSTVASIRQFVYLVGYGVATILVGRYVDAFGRAEMLRIITVQAVIFLAIIGVLAVRWASIQSKNKAERM